MDEEQKFNVTDKRGFTEDGTPRPVTEEQPAETPSAAAASETKEKSGEARPPIDFPSYILGYYTQGMVLLGEVPNPYTNKKEEDAESARNIIDILALLEQKTKGNLSSEENQLMESVLYELRMKFMAKTSRIKL